MNLIEKELINGIQSVINTITTETIDPSMVMIEIPKDSANGNYSSNIAMRLTKLLKRKPQEIAQEIANQLPAHCPSLEKVEIAGPGFLNFWIKNEALAAIIKTILEKDEQYGQNDTGQQNRVLVEWISANPTGPLHIGHARGAAWGDAVCRLLETSGYDVLREYYINDAGNQIQNLALSLIARYKESLGLPFELPQDGYHGDDVKLIANKLRKEFGDNLLENEDVIHFFTQKGIEYELDNIYTDLQLFRVDMESWQSEQDLYDTGKVEAVVERLKEHNLLYESEGALWFKSTDYGDDKDRVILKSDGTYTYLTPDIANHLDKIDRGYDKLINLWGADHHGYIPRMKAALEALGHKDVLEVDVVQIVRMIENGEEIKMSKRTGNAVTLRELCEDIGVDAVRYNMVSRALETHFDFDLGLARQQSNDNPVYYAQYAHARMCSIINKAFELKAQETYTRLGEEKEVDLLKHLGSFTDTIADAAKTRQPNRMVNYIHKLAQLLHSFYGAHKVSNPDELELSNERLALVKATQITMRNALALIGVSAPESMSSLDLTEEG